MVTFKVDQSDVKELGRDFERLIRKVGGVKPREFAKAANPYMAAIKVTAPKAGKEVKRYNTAKLIKSNRAPKGSGRVVARYAPGNAGRSFQPLRLRRVKNGTVIGPKRAKGAGAKGLFSGNRVDGYYVHILDQRKPFVAKTWRGARPLVLRNLNRLYKSKVKEALR